MLIIRLQRTGAKNKPDFRLVLAEKHRAAKKMAKEILGQYSPRTKELRLRDAERLKIWIARNVELSATARNLLISKKLIEGKKVQAWKPKRKEQPAAAAAPAPAPEASKEETK